MLCYIDDYAHETRYERLTKSYYERMEEIISIIDDHIIVDGTEGEACRKRREEVERKRMAKKETGIFGS